MCGGWGGGGKKEPGNILGGVTGGKKIKAIRLFTPPPPPPPPPPTTTPRLVLSMVSKTNHSPCPNQQIDIFKCFQFIVRGADRWSEITLSSVITSPAVIIL